MITDNQISCGVTHEPVFIDINNTGEWREIDHNQHWNNHEFHNPSSFEISQELQEVGNGCLWQHIMQSPVDSAEDTTKYCYQDQMNQPCNIIEVPDAMVQLQEQELCQSYHNSTPVHSLNKVPLLRRGNLVMPHQHTLTQTHQSSNIMARNHRAQITVVPTKSGNFKAIVKRKRKRTVFRTEQIEALEEYFSKKPYVTRDDRQVLVEQLNLDDKAVKIWFQNRRLKVKRDKEQSNPDEPMGESSSPDLRLDFVESQINEKTDEFGFVTLDDAVMGNLMNVIDNIMTNNNHVDVSHSETTEDESGSSPIYEPISPADCASEEDNLQWIPFEPKESLQRLFDLQSILPL